MGSAMPPRDPDEDEEDEEEEEEDDADEPWPVITADAAKAACSQRPSARARAAR
jgi:hypothetical protein